MDAVSGFGWPLAGIAVILIVGAFQVFNRLVAARNACGNARAGIDANLKKRHDLIPNLVSVVKGYTAHERETLVQVTRARSEAVSSIGTPASPAVESALTGALFSLDARVEAYPELKASEQFLNLQRTLTEIEEQISASRRAFNAHVMAMNNLVQQFPTLIVARLIGFAEMSFFKADEHSRSSPSVQL